MPRFAPDSADVPPAPPAPVAGPVPEPAVPAGPHAATPVRRRGLDAHRAFLLDQVQALRPLGIGLLEASGLTLCESIIADIDLPTVTAATTDGWAVRSADLAGAGPHRPVALPVVAEGATDGFQGVPLAAGTAVRVAAGTPVPEGADAIVALGDAEAAAGEVRFTAEAGRGQHLLPAGSRVADGDLLATYGTGLTPRVLALIAEVGHDKVLARPRPRVVVMTADTALVEPGRPLARITESYDACTTLLAATARSDGAQVFGAGIVPAEPKALARALGEQLVRADLVLLVTGCTDELVAALGAGGTIDVAEVDGLPGRQVFALLGPDRAPVLVLPPGPVPAHLCYLLLGRALVHRLAGDAATPAEAEAGVLAADVPADPAHTRLVLARRVDPGYLPLHAAHPGATELALADAVLVVPPGRGPAPAGAVVPCWSLD